MPTLTEIRQTVGRQIPSCLSWTDFVTGRSGESTSHLEVQLVSPRELTAEFVDHWKDLEQRSCHSNAFIGPDFLLPAWSLLPSQHEPLLLVVRERTSGQLMALGTFQRCWGSRTLPLPHLVAARTIHSFRTGILVDAVEAEPALEALLRYVSSAGWHGVLLPRMRLDYKHARHLTAVTAAAG